MSKVRNHTAQLLLSLVFYWPFLLLNQPKHYGHNPHTGFEGALRKMDGVSVGIIQVTTNTLDWQRSHVSARNSALLFFAKVEPGSSC